MQTIEYICRQPVKMKKTKKCDIHVQVFNIFKWLYVIEYNLSAQSLNKIKQDRLTLEAELSANQRCARVFQGNNFF